jgi:hypothetical protein
MMKALKTENGPDRKGNFVISDVKVLGIGASVEPKNGLLRSGNSGSFFLSRLQRNQGGCYV